MNDIRNNRRARYAWMLFDWASQPIATLIVTFIFAPYWVSAIVQNSLLGQQLIGYTNTIAGLMVALLAPMIGHLIDKFGHLKYWLALFSVPIIIGSTCLWFAKPGIDSSIWPFILSAYALTIAGSEICVVITNGMMPALSDQDNMGKLSGYGWGIGYLGGLLSLIINLSLFTETPNGLTILGVKPLFGLNAELREGTRFVGPFCALWYLVFVCPLFVWGPRINQPLSSSRQAFIPGLLASMKQPKLFNFLVGSMLYRDGLSGVFIFGGIVAVGVLNWSVVDLGVFGLLAAATGAIGSFIGGHVDSRYGSKPCITVCLWILIGCLIAAASITRTSAFGIVIDQSSRLPDALFYGIGGMLGFASGPIQAASRTLLTKLSRTEDMVKNFGIYAATSRATAFLAPLLVGITTQVTQSQRLGILPLVLLFLSGYAFIQRIHA